MRTWNKDFGVVQTPKVMNKSKYFLKNCFVVNGPGFHSIKSRTIAKFRFELGFRIDIILKLEGILIYVIKLKNSSNAKSLFLDYSDTTSSTSIATTSTLGSTTTNATILALPSTPSTQTSTSTTSTTTKLIVTTRILTHKALLISNGEPSN